MTIRAFSCGLRDVIDFIRHVLLDVDEPNEVGTATGAERNLQEDGKSFGCDDRPGFRLLP